MFEEVQDLLFGYRRPRFPLRTSSMPITAMEAPGLLYLPLVSGEGYPYRSEVKEGDEVKAGQLLASDGKRPVLASPAAGKVTGVTSITSLRGTSLVQALIIEPAKGGQANALPRLDPLGASPDQLMARLAEAGIMTDAQYPRLLADLLAGEIDLVIVNAADREPEVISALALFEENPDDVVLAAKMLGRVCSAKGLMIAGCEPALTKIKPAFSSADLTALTVPAVYPESLEPMLIRRAGGDARTRVVGVETALAALLAMREGQVQTHKVVTFISPAGTARRVLRVPLGARIGDLFSLMGLSPRDHDKVVAGGALRGFAQYSLEGAVDQGLDAVMLVPHEAQVAWTNEPCVSCGACPQVCPVKLQPQLLGRYAEFSLFDRTEDFDIMSCIECGLCAAVCTARRPLLQWIRLAKRELFKKQAAEEIAGAAACEDASEESAAASA